MCSRVNLRKTSDVIIMAWLCPCWYNTRRWQVKLYDLLTTVLYGVVKHNIRWLQRIQNSVTRVVVRYPTEPTYSSSEATATLSRCHRLPVKWRKKHKMATLAFKACSVVATSYLCNSILISINALSRLFSLSVANLLPVPPHILTFGLHAFSQLQHIWSWPEKSNRPDQLSEPWTAVRQWKDTSLSPT
jgi:hypothetical protein